MATQRTIAANMEQILKAEQQITMPLAAPVTAILPPVLDGSGLTVAANGAILSASCTSTGSLTLQDAYGHNIGTVAPGGYEEFMSQNGQWVRVPAVAQLALQLGQKATNGAVTPLLGANAPTAVVTTANPTFWYQVLLHDGTVGYIPVWK